MKTKAFVYTEMQNSVPFNDVPWADLNEQIAQEPGEVVAEIRTSC